MKRLVLYPFLFVLYAVLIPLVNNLGQVDISQALRPLALLLLAAAVLLLLFYALFRDWPYAGYLVFLTFAFFFLFVHLNRVTQEWLSARGSKLNEPLFLAAWAVLIAVLSLKKVWYRIGGQTWLQPFLNLVFTLALVMPVYTVVTRLPRQPLQARASTPEFLPNTGTIPLDCSNRPDIYIIFLDAYGRADVLEGLYDLDNQPFIDALTRKGFYVAGESHSNYTQTVFSIPTTLNFTYIESPPEGVEGLEYFTSLVKNSKIMNSLKSCGYRTVAIESGFSFTNHPDVDIYYAKDSRLNPFESLLLTDSPVEVISEMLELDPPENSYEAHRQRVLYSFEKLEELPRLRGPKVVFAHIISPHPPFIFDAEGQPVQPNRGYSIGDGSDFKGTVEEYREGYAAQVQFVNQKVEQVIDTILERSSNPPVIIIQGDHGPGSKLDWKSAQNSCLWERTSILNAYYLPNGGSSRLYPSITPVNSFRVVLDEYFGADLPLLPDRTNFTSHLLKNQILDVTDKTGSQMNCAP